MPGQNKLRILLVENEKSRGSALSQLQAQPAAARFDVSAAALGQPLKEGTEELYDVALMRFTEIDKAALDAVRELHGALPLLPIVVVSAEGSDEDSLEVMRAGADDHLSEPDINAAILGKSLAFAVARSARFRKRPAAGALREVQNTAGGILDRLPMGVVLVSAQGKVLLMNRRAREIAAQKDGFQIDREGNCRAANSDESQALAALIAKTNDPAEADNPESEYALSLSRPSMKQPLVLLVAPVGSGTGDRAGAAIFISDPENTVEISTDVLSRLYGLTTAESRVVKSLSQGKRLEELADEGGVTVNTVRHQLKQIFRKTDTTRQSELIKLVLTGPAAIRADAPPPAASASAAEL